MPESSDAKRSLQDQRVLEYIAKETSRSFTPSQIREKLLQAGYKAEYLDEIFARIPASSKQQARAPKPTTQNPQPRTASLPKWLFPTAIIVSILLILTLSTLLLLDSGCKDRLCFIDKAANCEKSEYKEPLDDIVFKYKIIPASNGCILEKTLLKAPSEPAENRAILEGASMQCSYSRFDPSYITSITGKLNTCKGELKDALTQAIALS